MPSQLLLAVGIALIIFGCLYKAYKGGDYKETAVFLVFGLLLIAFSDSNFKMLSCTLTEGCKFERSGLSAEEQLKGLVKAELDSRFVAHTNDLQSKFVAINTAIEAVRSGRTAAVKLPDSEVSSRAPKEGPTVLVFYRDGQEIRARSLSRELQEAGYKTSATNSTLKEIERWTERADEGYAVVAVGSNDSGLGRNLKAIADRSLRTPVQVIYGWSFRASAAQVYLF